MRSGELDHIGRDRERGLRPTVRRRLLARQTRRQLERGERVARIAAREVHDRIERIGVEREFALEAALVVERALDDRNDVFIGKRAQLDDARTRDERGVHFEIRIFGSGADQDDRAVFHRVQQRVLLAAVEAVDLVDEQDGAHAVDQQALFGGGDFAAQIGHGAADGRYLHEGRARAFGHDVRDARLARSGRAEQDGRRQGVRLDRREQPAAGTDRVLLAGQLVERARTHAHGKRRGGEFRGVFYFGEKGVHAMRSRVPSPRSDAVRAPLRFVRFYYIRTPVRLREKAAQASSPF